MINGHYEPYMQAAIDGEVARLASSQEGERNQNLFKSSASLASLGLREGEILHHLKPVAETIGVRGRELYATVKSGVKAGHSSPRDMPSTYKRGSASAPPARTAGTTLPSRTAPDSDGQPKFFVGDDEGPRVTPDEARRHVYCRDGKPVRIKVRRSAGYVNWYRVIDGTAQGWQAAKPDGYTPCPYVGRTNPFDHEIADETIYWPEGEKDCDTLGDANLPAFTFGGTGDGLPEGAADALHGRDVVILVDNDSSGRSHAAKKAALAYSTAASVKVVEFPELPPKGDVTDFLKAASAADLERRVGETPLWAPIAHASTPTKGWRSAVITANDLREKTFNPVRYVVSGYIPEGVTVFAGKPKIGKSWLLYDICLASASGRFVLGNIKPIQAMFCTWRSKTACGGLRTAFRNYVRRVAGLPSCHW